MEKYSPLKVLRYLPRFAFFVFKLFPSAWFAALVATFGVLLEYAALSVMLPLVGPGAQGGKISNQVVQVWREIAIWLTLPDDSRTWLWIFILLLGVRIAVGFIQTALNTWVSKKILSHLSGGIFSRVVVHEPLMEVYRRSVGYYTALAGDESVRLGQVFFHFAQTISAMVAAVIGLVVLFLFSVLVFKLTLIFLTISTILIGVSTKRIFIWSRESALLSKELNTTFIEAFNGIRSIRSMAGENFVVKRYQDFIERYGRILFYLDVFNHGSRIVPGLILIVMGLILLYPTAGNFQEFSTIYFFTATTMLIRVLGFLGVVVSSGGRIAIDIRAAFDLDDLTNVGPKKNSDQKLGQQVSSVKHISMSNLSCGYGPTDIVLSSVNAELLSGRRYALVGLSGSGKSTLSDVLLGLLSPISGDLRIENCLYDKLNLASMRRKVILVEQQTRIFSGSLAENISFGLQLSVAEIQEAVEAAGLSEFVTSLQKGLNTILDYQGANLSGGQRQRIGLARALVRMPDVLILDEATSALDGHTRDIVVKNLSTLFADKILLFITHDSHIIQSVDEVWHLKKGTLVVERKMVAV